MQVKIGDKVKGTSGDLGEIVRMVVSPNTDHVDEIVVKHGMLLSQERIVPLKHVQRVEGDAVYLDLDDKALGTMDLYSKRAYRAGDPDYAGPPSHDLEGTYRGDLTVGAAFVPGATAMPGGAAKPMGYPGGEQLVPGDKQIPVISKGSGIFDNEGHKVGEVSDFGADPETMRLSSLGLKQGLLQKDVKLPVEWVKQLDNDGVTLHVSKNELDEFRQRSASGGEPA